MPGINLPRDLARKFELDLSSKLKLPDGSIRIIERGEKIEIFVSQFAVHLAGLPKEELAKELNSVSAKIRSVTKKRVVTRTPVAADAIQESMENALVDAIKRQVTDDVANVFFSNVNLPDLDVFVELSSNEQQMDDLSLQKKLKELLRKTLRESKLKLGAIAISNGQENLPGSLALLALIKVIQPADLSRIRQQVLQAGFQVRSDRWLTHQLDGLRKANCLIRSSESGSYCLTYVGLSALPVSKTRNSSDVKRLLSFGKTQG